MKIGIISDTHNDTKRTQEVVEQLLQNNISYLIHAGDIGQKVLDLLSTLPIKTIAVYGNTDRGRIVGDYSNIILQNPLYYFKIKDTTFKLMHEPYYLTPDSDVVIFGHTHMYECKKDRSLYLNPGEVCAREKPLIESALLELPSLRVTRIYKDLKQYQWIEERCA